MNLGPQTSETFRAKVDVNLRCTDCEATNLVEESSSGDLVCGDCGLVMEERIIDSRSEWRTFANDDREDPSRVGSAQDPFSIGLQTHSFETRISSKDGDNDTYKALQRAASRVSTSRDRNFQEALNLTQSKGDSIALERYVIDTAKQIFSIAFEEGILRNKDEAAIVGASIYLSCKSHHVSRSIIEIVKMIKAPKNHIVECINDIKKCSKIVALLGSDRGEEDGGSKAQSAMFSPTDPAHLVGRFSNHLGIKVKGFTSSAESLTRSIMESGLLSGRSPVTIAAASLLMTCYLWDEDAKRSAKQISEVASISEATIRAVYRLLVSEQKESNTLIREDFVERYRSRIDLTRL